MSSVSSATEECELHELFDRMWALRALRQNVSSASSSIECELRELSEKNVSSMSSPIDVSFMSSTAEECELYELFDRM